MSHIGKEGYRYISAKSFGDDKAKSYLEHRWLMEQHLGRKLNLDEVVHHKNEDKLDNRIENLEVISRAEHTRQHQPKAKLFTGICPVCNKEFERSLPQVKCNKNKGRAGPFCSRQCAGKHSTLPK